MMLEDTEIFVGVIKVEVRDGGQRCWCGFGGGVWRGVLWNAPLHMELGALVQAHGHTDIAAKPLDDGNDLGKFCLVFSV